MPVYPTTSGPGDTVFLDSAGKLPAVDGSQLTSVSASYSTGKTLWVDTTNGDDGTGVSGLANRPFKTISAALTAATSGDTIRVFPGIYDEILTMVSGVSVSGLDQARCILQRANSSSETIVNMSTLTRFENFTINANPSANNTTCIAFGGTSLLSSTIKDITIVDGSTATGKIFGISVSSTSSAPQGHWNAVNCIIKATAAGSIGVWTTGVGGISNFLNVFADQPHSGDSAWYIQNGTVRLWQCRGSGARGLDILAGGSVIVDAASSFNNIIISTPGTLTRDLLGFPRKNETTSNPAVTDDISKGYGTHSTWINTTTNSTFICTNNAVGAAVWIPLQATSSTADGFSLVVGGYLSSATLPTSGLGTEIVKSAYTLTSISGRRGVVGSSGTSTIQLELNGSLVSGTTLSWTNSDAAFALKTATFSQAVSAGDRLSLRLTSAEAGGEDIFVRVS